MSELIERGDTLPQDLAQVATDALKRRLAEQMELSARHLVEMAAIWTELERRGEDLSALRTSLTDYLPRIAAGDLDAQAVVQFAGNRQLLRYLGTLPVDRQRQLMEVGEIELVLPESGEITKRKLVHLSGRDVTQVFGHGLVRGPDAQRRLIESKQTVKPKAGNKGAENERARIRYGALEVDGERISAGGKPLRADDLLELLSRHYGVDLAESIRGGSSK